MAAESLPLRPPFGGLEPGSPTDLTRCYSLPMAENVKNTEGRSRTTVSSKHQVTIPKLAMRQAGLRAGDRLRAVVSGRSRVLLVREDDPVARHAGKLSGAYRPDELNELRGAWR